MSAAKPNAVVVQHFFAGVYCHGHDLDDRGPCNQGLAPVELSPSEYLAQLNRVDHGWKCPRCGAPADWDDHSGASS